MSRPLGLMSEWTIENLTSRLRQMQYDAAMSTEEMCEFLEDFLRRHEKPDVERTRNLDG